MKFVDDDDDSPQDSSHEISEFCLVWYDGLTVLGDWSVDCLKWL